MKSKSWKIKSSDLLSLKIESVSKNVCSIKVAMDDGEKADHDFDVVTHDGCNYKDDGKGLQIDVEKIVGVATDGVCILQSYYKRCQNMQRNMCYLLK